MLGVMAVGPAVATQSRLWEPVSDQTPRPNHPAFRPLLWAAVIAPGMTPIQPVTEQIAAPAVPITLRACVALVLLLAATIVGRKTYRPVHAGEFLLALFAGMAGLSALWSVSPSATASKAVMLGTTLTALILLARSYPSRDAAVGALARLLHGALLLTLCEALIFPSRTLVGGDGTQPIRLQTLFPSISFNQLGHVAAIGVILLLFKVGPPRILRFRIPILCLYIAELWATQTRSAYVLAGIALIMAFCWAVTRYAYALPAGFLTAAAGLYIYAQYGGELSAVFQRGQSEELFHSLSGRTVFWDSAYALWQDHPWLGLGYYSGHVIALPEISHLPKLPNIDNTWLECLLDVGILGTLPLAAFVLLAARRAIFTDLGISTEKRWVMAIIVAYYTTVSFFNPTLQASGAAQVIFGFACLATAGRRSPETPPTRGPARSPSSPPAERSRGPRSPTVR